jgi:hypothetical protein
MQHRSPGPSSRRAFLHQAAGVGLVASAFALTRTGRAADASGEPLVMSTRAKAKRAIWLFMSGGPSQLDLFDYKPDLGRYFDQDLPESVIGSQRLTGMTSGQARLAVAPSRFPFARGGQSGAWVSDLLPWTRQIVDKLAIVNSVSTEAINHEPGILAMNTGSQLAGKPPLGAWLSHGLGPIDPDLPTFAVMTSAYSSKGAAQPLAARLWSSAFLPARNGGVLMRGIGEPVLYLQNPPGINPDVRRVMVRNVASLNHIAGAGTLDQTASERSDQYQLALRMQTSVPGLTDLTRETPATLSLYGEGVHTPGSFAANCIGARRMLESGIRFVQIYHRGWDAHQDTPGNHILQCRDVDQACYGLITDLEARGMLEDTLVIWGGEFGRTVYCQGDLTRDNYGRDHHARCFSMWLAGGGVRAGTVHGETDDFGYNVVTGEAPLRDLHATILHLFGLDPDRLTFRNAGLEEKLVGVGEPAQIIRELLA